MSEIIWYLSFSICLILLSIIPTVQFSSVAQSCLTLCDPMNRSMIAAPCPLPTPGVHPDSRPSSQWCHLAISSSVVPFSSCPQSLPASESFPMSQLFAWGGRSAGVSALASFLPKKSQDWSPLEWTGWIFLQCSRRDLKSLLQHHSSKAAILRCSAFFTVQLSHPYMTTGKTIALTRRTFVGKVMCLLFNMLSRLVITLLPRRKCLVISWLQSPSAVILEPPAPKKVWRCSHCFPIYFPWSDGTRCHDFHFLNVEL